MKFYWKRNLSLYLALTGVFASSVLAADKSDLELEQRLNQSLQSLEDHARHERYVSGITSLTFAGLSTIAAFATISNSQPVIPATLGVLGALFGVSGGLTLAFPTDFERMPERYRLLPSDSADLRHSKVMVGELTLDQLSASARSSRLTGAGVLCAFGAGFRVWAWPCRTPYPATLARRADHVLRYRRRSLALLRAAVQRRRLCIGRGLQESADPRKIRSHLPRQRVHASKLGKVRDLVAQAIPLARTRRRDDRDLPWLNVLPDYDA